MKIQALFLTLLACVSAAWVISQEQNSEADQSRPKTILTKNPSRKDGYFSPPDTELPAKRRQAGEAHEKPALPAGRTALAAARAGVSKEELTFEPEGDAEPQRPRPGALRESVPPHLPEQERERLGSLLEVASVTPDAADDRAAMRELHRARIATRRSDPESDFTQ